MGRDAPSKPYGLALIGTGMVAPTHVRAIRDAATHATLRGVLSRRPENAQALIDQFDWGDARPRVYAELGDIVADDSVDIAIVVTPPNARSELIGPLAGAGKHVLLEKPVARTTDEAAEVVRICEDAGVSLGMFFQHRMRRASLSAAALIADGELGQLGMVEIAIPWWREQGYYDEPGRGTYDRDGGGVLISQAIHTIDLALSLTGPVTQVQAMTATTCFHTMEAEDFATAGLTFASGAVGSLVASTAAFPGRAETIILHFERASLRLDSGVLTVSWRDGRIEEHGDVAGTGGGADPMAFTHEWHQGILIDFIQSLDSGHKSVATGADALAVHRLITAIEISAREGRSVEVIE